MLDHSLSSRRPLSSVDDVLPEASSSSAHGDDLKVKKKTLPDYALGFICRLYHSHTCSASYIVIATLVGFLVTFLLLQYNSFTCYSPVNMSYRNWISEVDATGVDFGSLGVPTCRSRQGQKVAWTSKDLLEHLEEFVKIYETRPIKHNMYGMGFDHSFGLWFIAQWLKPELMIESGVFKGHSTWVLRQAMPDAAIISLSPRHPEKYLKKGPAYVDRNCTYYTGKSFIDFGSVDWKDLMKKRGIHNLTRVLVFFDDHQNELKRVKQALNAGFHHLIFEDNYDTGTGDHYSLRQICDQFYIRGGGHICFKDSDEARMRSKRKKFWDKAVEITDLCDPGGAWWGVRGLVLDNFNRTRRSISHEEHFRNSRFLESVLDLYWEMPPVAGPSLTHQTRYDPARVKDPIVEDGRYRLFRRLGLHRLDYSVFNGYTQMAYLRISKRIA